VFLVKEPNEAGIYAMQFFLHGEPKFVVVDELLPCDEQGRPLFGTSKVVGEVWLSLLEKAWAKLHTNYALSRESTPDLVWSALTNKPTQICFHANFKRAVKIKDRNV